MKKYRKKKSTGKILGAGLITLVLSVGLLLGFSIAGDGKGTPVYDGAEFETKTFCVPFGTTYEEIEETILATLPTKITCNVTFSDGSSEKREVEGYWEDEEIGWGWGYYPAYNPNLGGCFMFSWWSDTFDAEIEIDWVDYDEPLDFPYVLVYVGEWITGFEPAGKIHVEAPLNTPQSGLGLPASITATTMDYQGNAGTAEIPLTWAAPKNSPYTPSIAGIYRFNATANLKIDDDHSFAMPNDLSLPYGEAYVGTFIEDWFAAADVSAPIGSLSKDAGLPETLTAKLLGGGTAVVPVAWTYSSNVIFDTVTATGTCSDTAYYCLKKTEAKIKISGAAGDFPTYMRVQLDSTVERTDIEDVSEPQDVDETSKSIGLTYFVTLNFAGGGGAKERTFTLKIPKGFRVKELTGRYKEEEERDEANNILYLMNPSAKDLESVTILDSKGDPYGSNHLSESTWPDYSGTITYVFKETAKVIELQISFMPYLYQVDFIDSYIRLTDTVTPGLDAGSLPKGTKVEVKPFEFLLKDGANTVDKSFQGIFNYTERSYVSLSGSRTVVSAFPLGADKKDPNLSQSIFNCNSSGGPNQSFYLTFYRWADGVAYPLYQKGDVYVAYTMPKGIYLNSVGSGWELYSALEGGKDIKADFKPGYITKDQTVVIYQLVNAVTVSSISPDSPASFKMVEGEEYYSNFAPNNTATIITEAYARLFDDELNEGKYAYSRRDMVMVCNAPVPNVSAGSWNRYTVDWNYNNDFYNVYKCMYNLGGFAIGNTGTADTNALDVSIEFDENCGLLAIKLPALYSGGTASNIKMTTFYWTPEGNKAGRELTFDDHSGSWAWDLRKVLEPNEYPRTLTYHVDKIPKGQSWVYGGPHDYGMGYCYGSNGEMAGVLLNTPDYIRNNLTATFYNAEGTAYDPEQKPVEIYCGVYSRQTTSIVANLTVDKGNNSYYPGDTINATLTLNPVNGNGYMYHTSDCVVNPVVYFKVPYLDAVTGQHLFEFVDEKITGHSGIGDCTFTTTDLGTVTENGVIYKCYRLSTDTGSVSEVKFAAFRNGSWNNGSSGSGTISLRLRVCMDNPCDQHWNVNGEFFVDVQEEGVVASGQGTSVSSAHPTGFTTKRYSLAVTNGTIYDTPLRSMVLGTVARLEDQEPGEGVTFNGTPTSILHVPTGKNAIQTVDWANYSQSDFYPGTTIYIPITREGVYSEHYFNDAATDDTYFNYVIPEMNMFLTKAVEIDETNREKFTVYYATSYTENENIFTSDGSWQAVSAEWKTADKINDWSKVVMVKMVSDVIIHDGEFGSFDMSLRFEGDTGEQDYVRPIVTSVLQADGKSVSINYGTCQAYEIANDTLDGKVYAAYLSGEEVTGAPVSDSVQLVLSGKVKTRNVKISSSEAGKLEYVENEKDFEPVEIVIGEDGLFHYAKGEDPGKIGDVLYLEPGEYTLNVESTGWVFGYFEKTDSEVTRSVDQDGNIVLTGTWGSDVTPDAENRGNASFAFEVTAGETRHQVVGIGLKLDRKTLAITGEKVITGDTPKTAVEFTFKLEGQEGNEPMPEGAEEGTLTVKRSGAGEISFGSIDFTEPGEYTYFIWEVAGEEEGYTYDSTSYRLTVTVTEGESSFIMTPVYSELLDGGEAAAEKPVFTNMYEDPFTPPPTGDHAEGILFWGIALFAAAGIIFTLISRKKLFSSRK